MALRYRPVRVWRVPPDKWLTGGLGLVPLAPLGDVRQEELRNQETKVQERQLRSRARYRRTTSPMRADSSAARQATTAARESSGVITAGRSAF